MADQSLTETDKHLWIDNYSVFIIPNVWTVATVSVFWMLPLLKIGWHLVGGWKVITQEMSQSL